MGPPTYMRSVLDRNILMRRSSICIYGGPLQSMPNIDLLSQKVTVLCSFLPFTCERLVIVYMFNQKKVYVSQSNVAILWLPGEVLNERYNYDKRICSPYILG
jgi:hypothetical protein